jgi:hypothetical protein
VTRTGSRARSTDAVKAERVALIPSCAECPAVWLLANKERWSAYLTDDDEVVFYCPVCATEEFGPA